MKRLGFLTRNWHLGMALHESNLVCQCRGQRRLQIFHDEDLCQTRCCSHTHSSTWAQPHIRPAWLSPGYQNLCFLLQVLGQGELRIFDEGQTLLSRGYPHTQQVFILLRGHITMHLADSRTFTAGAHALQMLLPTQSWPASYRSPLQGLSTVSGLSVVQ